MPLEQGASPENLIETAGDTVKKSEEGCLHPERRRAGVHATCQARCTICLIEDEFVCLVMWNTFTLQGLQISRGPSACPNSLGAQHLGCTCAQSMRLTMHCVQQFTFTFWFDGIILGDAAACSISPIQQFLTGVCLLLFRNEPDHGLDMPVLETACQESLLAPPP